MKRSEEFLLKHLSLFNINDLNIFYTMLDIYNDKTKQEFNGKLKQLDDTYNEIDKTQKDLDEVKNKIGEHQGQMTGQHDMFDTMKTTCENLARLNPDKKEEYEKDLLEFKENTTKINKSCLEIIELYLPSKYRVERRMELLREMEQTLIECLKFFVNGVVLGSELFGLKDELIESGESHEN